MRREVGWRFGAMALMVVFVLLYLAPLGVRPLAMPDEFRYAEIAREMLTGGDWVSPHLDGVRYFEKPILGYWLDAISLATLGVNAFAVRLSSAIATGLTALFMFGFLRLLGADLALAVGTSAILLTSLAVWLIGGLAILDAVLTLWLTLTVGLYYLSYVASGRRRRMLQALAGLCCGLAFLTKGFLALAIPVLIAVPFLCWQRDWARLLRDAWLPFLVAVAVSLPWSVMIHGREPDYWNYFIWEQHIRRFFSRDAQHSRPFWWYFAFLPAMALPWSLFIPAALTGLLRPSLDRRLLRYAWLWFLMPLLFFSASRGKQPAYVLPCLPPLSLLLAHGIQRYQKSGRTLALRWGAAGLATLFAAGVAYLLGTGLGLFGEPLFARTENGRWLLALAVSTWGLIVAASGAWPARASRPWTLGVAVLGIFLAAPFIIPDQTREAKMPGSFLMAQRAEVPDNAVIVVTAGLAGSVAWAFQRDDLYVVGAGGELSYGMSWPNAAGRLIGLPAVARLIRANAGRRDVVIVTWTERQDELRPYVPSAARRAQYGEVTLWQIEAAGGAPQRYAAGGLTIGVDVPALSGTDRPDAGEPRDRRPGRSARIRNEGD